MFSQGDSRSSMLDGAALSNKSNINSTNEAEYVILLMIIVGSIIWK